MALDPIVQLAVGMATSPRAFAVLIGSGVSLEAGVPTGEQVLTATKERLFDASCPDENRTPARLQAWLEEQGLGDASYSELLEAAFPAEQSRRDFLAGFFDGTRAGPSHRALAQLAADGLVSVFVTTNFDTHLEDALREVGVQPVVVSDGPTLDRAPARETAEVFVVKAHGDVGQVNIRNTLPELDDLGERMQQELDEICSRRGVIVLGYSGRDAAISRALRRTSPRFGLYWASRRPQCNPEADAIIHATGGRVIVRSGATDFLADLAARLRPLLDHPGGSTPTSIRAEMISRLRAGDAVGVRELLREQQRAFEVTWANALRDAHEKSPGNAVDQDAFLALEATMSSALGRHLASVLPVIEYDVSMLQIELDWLASFAELETGIRSQYSAWVQANRIPAWHVMWALSAVGYALGHFDVLRGMWTTTTRDDEPLALMLQLGGHELERQMHFAKYGTPPSLDGLTHTARMLLASGLLADHYPEVDRGPSGDHLGAVIGNLQNASYLHAAYAARRGTPTKIYTYGPPSHSTVTTDIGRPDRFRAIRRALFNDDKTTTVPQIVGWAGESSRH